MEGGAHESMGLAKHLLLLELRALERVAALLVATPLGPTALAIVATLVLRDFGLRLVGPRRDHTDP